VYRNKLGGEDNSMALTLTAISASLPT
jgi:hypothetical protein